METPEAGLEALEAWLEAPDAWLEAHEAWLEALDAWPGGGTDGWTDVRTDRTKSPYSIGHRPLRGRCPKTEYRRNFRHQTATLPFPPLTAVAAVTKG